MLFLKNYAENDARRPVPDLFSHFKKAFYIRLKQVVSTLVLIYFGRPRLGHKIKTDLIRI